jgi:hypothetical protein
VTVLLLALLLALLPNAYGDQMLPVQPRWHADVGTYGYRSFQHTWFPMWKRQQGLVFLSPKVLAVYQVQVSESEEPMAPGQRDLSGGAGKYHLLVSFFETSDGRLLKQLRLVTSAEVSQVLPTYEGRFIVRTGQALHLFSAAFEETGTVQLPLNGVAKNEWWETEVSPSGAQLWLVHHEDFGYRAAAPSRAEVEVLGTNTFEAVAKIRVRGVNDWSAGDNFATAAHPDTGLEHGVLTLDGVWSSIRSVSRRYLCPSDFVALSHQRFVFYECSSLRVFALSGEEIFSRQISTREAFIAVSKADSFLAAEVDRRKPNPFDSSFKSQPLRVVIYDLKRQSEMASIPVSGELVEFAISPEANFATIEGKVLKVFDVSLPAAQDQP